MRGKRYVSILGSTGSIGVSTIDVIRRLPGFRVAALAARSNAALLERQVRELKPGLVAVYDEAAAAKLARRLGRRFRVVSGPEGVRRAAVHPDAGTVVCAMVGSAGLVPAHAAVAAGRRVALANKETMVAAGEIITRLAARTGAEIIPVDSEHSAIFQCLEGRDPRTVRRIILTASGGPFHGRRSLEGISVRQALAHPTWRMGRKVTIDSATLMNKGLELIEARWLFGVPAEAIEVVVHRQSIVHSLVEFTDGSVLAQMGNPDMRLPIQYALTHPGRLPSPVERLDLARVGNLTFEPPDPAIFTCLSHARRAVELGGYAPVVLNAANEVAVQAFLDRKLGFAGIGRVIGAALRIRPRGKPRDIREVLQADRDARAVAGCIIAMVS